MKLSNYPLLTFRDDPSAVEMASNRLLLRSGMLVFVTGGVYVYTHFLDRVIRKITQITREEMNRVGAVEITMPILQPRELWEQTGRWPDYVASKTMLRVIDRQGAELGLAPTAEEVVTMVAKGMANSYRQLPFTLYQIRTKFRDEVRTRGGLIRGREFEMYDGYSFDRDQDGLNRSYELQRQAYERVYARCGLPVIYVQADSGAIGGSSSHEFMVVAEAGEDKVITCTKCDYRANVERAVSNLTVPEQEDEKPIHLESTPNARTVDDLVALFKMPPSQMVKTILYEVEYKGKKPEVVAVLMRGDCEINETKLKNHLGNVASLTTASQAVVEDATEAAVGFAGPVGLNKIRIVADESVRPLKNFLCGANKTGYHLLDVNWGRDFPEPVFVDLRSVAAGEACVHCGSPLQVTRGIEVGHLFDLGCKYSHKPQGDGEVGIGATYSDEDGVERDMVMGCYGIGITRIAAAAIEISHDEHGIIWPFNLAPYEVAIVTAGSNPEVERAAAEKLYADLTGWGVEVVYDDRELRIGVKLADMDLLGFPYKLIVGKGLAKGVIDLKDRKTGETQSLAVEKAADKIAAIIAERRKQANA